MPTTTTLNVTFDGINDVARLPGDSAVSWDGSGMGYYSVYEDDPNAEFIANVGFSGSSWKARTLRFGAEQTNTTVLTDLDAGEGRRVDFIQLGYNSDVDLISTRMRYVFGWDGDLHDVKLGSGYTYAMNLYATRNIVDLGDANVGFIETADGMDTIRVGEGNHLASAKTQGGDDDVTVDGGSADSLNLGYGDDTLHILNGGYVNHARDFGGANQITVEDTARLRGYRSVASDTTIDLQDDAAIYNLDITDGSGDVSVADGFIDSFFSWNASITLYVGADGFLGQARLTGDEAQTHNIRIDGSADVLAVNGDHTTTLKLGAGDVGGVALGGGDDKVATGTGFVDILSTGAGRDAINLGSGGAGVVRMGGGSDTLRLGDLTQSGDMLVQGGEGSDWVSFYAVTQGISINLNGGNQLVGSTNITMMSIENLQATAQQDSVYGSEDDNILMGLAGDDVIYGNGGDDNLNGGTGHDRLEGSWGDDILFGAGGRDILIGGSGDDSMRGGQGADVFVFQAYGDGVDTISKYSQAQDTIAFQYSNGLTFEDLEITTVGSDLHITYSEDADLYGGATIVLENRSSLTLTADDFSFDYNPYM